MILLIECPISDMHFKTMYLNIFMHICFLPTYSVLGNKYFASMDVLKHESCTLTKNKLSLLIRIDNFPSFVTTKDLDCSRYIFINTTQWYIIVGMIKCRNVNETSDHPESLAAYILGRGEEGIDCSFDVEAKIKFKNPLDENKFKKKFCFNSSNGYEDVWGSLELTKINVIFTFFSKIPAHLRT